MSAHEFYPSFQVKEAAQREYTDISKLQKASWQKRCLQGNKGNAERNEKANLKKS